MCFVESKILTDQPKFEKFHSTGVLGLLLQKTIDGVALLKQQKWIF